MDITVHYAMEEDFYYHYTCRINTVLLNSDMQASILKILGYLPEFVHCSWKSGVSYIWITGDAVYRLSID